MQQIISWNVASVRARLDNVLKLLNEKNPDIVFLQEIKTTDDTFPSFDFLTEGYQAVINGQKSYNGVAILSKKPLVNVIDELPGFQDGEPKQARFIQAEDQEGTVYICVYVPNGNAPEKNPQDTSKLQYKLEWMQAFNAYIDALLKQGKSVIFGGDFNVIERDTDVYNPDAYRTNALMVAPVRQRFAELNALPVTNTIRHFNPEPHTYSFWDFQMMAWSKNWGMLLDALFVSNNLMPTVTKAGVLKEVRGWDKTSDHAPIYCTLNK
ncbi:MAG: exodeoxyribonuclease III [Alphaproteobacteria bacterium]|nr:exodeoxyribonuclease III [Alphaproteobacteria bacterium]